LIKHHFDLKQVIPNIQATPCLQNTNSTVDELVDAYNSGFEALIDKHAPVIKKDNNLEAPRSMVF
jgi:hypothetical protein